MAQWVTRQRADGAVSVQIKWRMDGRWQSETFTDLRLAAEFRTAVEIADHRWPDGWVKGEGWKPREPEPETVTFAQVAHGTNGYFALQARRAKLGKLKPRTLHAYRRTYALHFEEVFGPVAFESIDTEDIADWIDTQIEAGWRPKTIRNNHSILSSIMKHGALRMKLRADNPCQVSDLPDLNNGTSEVRQIRFFQPEEWSLFRSFVKPDFLLLMDFLLATGVRWGEISALRVGDIAFQTTGGTLQANIHVVRAWSRRAPDDDAPIRFDQDEDQTWVLGPPKSKRPRWVVASGDVAMRLRDAIRGRIPSEYVFLTREGCPWRYQHFHDRRWTPAKIEAQKAGLTKKITPHMLRHTTVVWSLADGVPIEKVSEMIGHASLQITYDIYGGLITLQDPAMAKAMARAMLSHSTSSLPGTVDILSLVSSPERSRGEAPVEQTQPA
jgi:integrase